MSAIVLQMSDVLSECSLSLWLHNLKTTDHTVSYFTQHRFIKLGTWERLNKGWMRGCQCCLGDIVLYCMLSLTPSKFVWTCIWSISTVYFFSQFFVVVVVVLHCNLTEVQVRYFWQLWTLWRQHWGDSRPLRVFVCEYLPAYQNVFLPVFSQRDRKGSVAQRKIRLWGRKTWMCAIVFYCTLSAPIFQY